MLVMFINLSGFFFRPNILKLQKLGITLTHSGIMLMLIGSGLTSIFSTEGNMIIDEGKKSNFFDYYYVKVLISFSFHILDHYYLCNIHF